MSGFDRLQSADPAVQADDLAIERMRKRIRVRRVNPTSLVAAVAAFALVAGGGVAVGRVTAPQPTSLADGTLNPGGMQGPQTATKDAARSYASPMWWGTTILIPSSSITDNAGTASAYEFTTQGLDHEKFVKALAAIIGAKGDVTTQEDGFRVGDGNSAMAWMTTSDMGNFSAYHNDKSSWSDCAKANSDGTSADTNCQESSDPADKKAAEDAFNKVLKLLGLDASDVVIDYPETGTAAVYTIQGMMKIDGKATNQNRLSVTSSAKGVWSIDGIAAFAKEVKGYDLVGARTAAKRAESIRWSAFGPSQFGMWQTPIAYDSMARTNNFTVDGRQGFKFSVEEVLVKSAVLGLVGSWDESGMRLVPAWIYTADDGRQWSIIAVADKYVKF